MYTLLHINCSYRGTIYTIIHNVMYMYACNAGMYMYGGMYMYIMYGGMYMYIMYGGMYNYVQFCGEGGTEPMYMYISLCVQRGNEVSQHVCMYRLCFH